MVNCQTQDYQTSIWDRNIQANSPIALVTAGKSLEPSQSLLTVCSYNIVHYKTIERATTFVFNYHSSPHLTLPSKCLVLESSSFFQGNFGLHNILSVDPEIYKKGSQLL